MNTVHMLSVAELLAFENAHPRNGGAKEDAIIRAFGIAPARYFQQLDRVIDTREADELDPLLVHRLRRIRDARAAARTRRMGAA